MPNSRAALLAPLAALLAAVLLAANALAKQSPIGTPAPEFDALEWFNSRPLALSELRGKVVYLIAVRTWSEHCKGIAGALAAKLERDGPRGLVVIAITAEEEPTLVERWIQSQRVAIPVALLKSREFERAIGLDGFPHAAVIDSKGTIVYADDFGKSENALGKALESATKGSIVPAKLEATTALVRHGEYESAWAELVKLRAAAKSADELAELEQLSKYLEGRAARRVKRAREWLDAGYALEAQDQAASIARAKPEYPASADARALLELVAKLPDGKGELKAGEEFRALRLREESGNYASAIAGYRELAKKYPALAIARAVRARAGDLVRRGMPGWDWSCDECKKLGRACAKHLLKVELW